MAAVVALSLSAAACASAPPPQSPSQSYADYRAAPRTSQSFAHIEIPRHKLQCVPFARRLAGISIHGDAWTWWRQAAGRFPRGYQPIAGAIAVFDGYAGPHRAHLAVVRAIISSRVIRIDHANWLDHGNIFLNDPVMDVSAENDWSEVRVYNLATHAWGGHVYHVRGFIGPTDDGEYSPRLAERS
jgi:surface antigen